MINHNRKGKGLGVMVAVAAMAVTVIVTSLPALAATVSVAGSTTVYPITVAASSAWTGITGHSMSISQGGSGNGRELVMNNQVDIG